ncbi:unnamed protein product, partial [marine sediment metagenome]
SPGESWSEAANQGEDSRLPGSMCRDNKTHWSHDNGEAYQASSYTTPCNGLRTLKEMTGFLVAGVNIASAVEIMPQAS